MPVIGSVMPSAEFSTAKLLRYIDTMGELVLAFEVICGLFVLYYIVEEITTISAILCFAGGKMHSMSDALQFPFFPFALPSLISRYKSLKR